MAELSKDPTLDEVRVHLAPLLPAHAAFDGWTLGAVALAAAQAGIDPDIARLAFKEGAVQMIDGWFRFVDDAMATRLPAEQIAPLKIRARITELIWTRIEIIAPEREALRRALAILAMPQNGSKAVRMGWRAVDLIWRMAGDKATDFNHYTKRITLAAVYASTIAALLDDETPDFADTRAFLERRIGNVMQFEGFKADFKSRARHRPSLSRFVGRLRYPAI